MLTIREALVRSLPGSKVELTRDNSGNCVFATTKSSHGIPERKSVSRRVGAESKSADEQYRSDSICQRTTEEAVEGGTPARVRRAGWFSQFPGNFRLCRPSDTHRLAAVCSSSIRSSGITRKGNYENSNYVSVIDDRVCPGGLYAARSAERGMKRERERERERGGESLQTATQTAYATL